MSETPEPEVSQGPEPPVVNPIHVVQQTLLLLMGFAAVLAGLALYTLIFLRIGRWLLG